MGESFVGIDEFGEVWNQSIKFKKGLCSGFIDLCSCFIAFVQPKNTRDRQLDAHTINMDNLSSTKVKAFIGGYIAAVFKNRHYK